MSSSTPLCPTPLMLFHGLMSSPQEFGLIAHALRSKGLRHEAPSVPGYTHADDPMTPSWLGWRTGAREQVEERALADGRVVVGGLCMGGILAAAAALEAPERVAGLVLMSPSFAFDGWGLTWLRHLRHLAYWSGTDRFFAMKERAPYGVKNEKIRRWIKNELEQRAQSAAGPARVPLPALRQAEHMLADVKARLHELRCPILVIHAREDEVSSLASTERFFASLPQVDKELVVLENSYHMITIDNDRSQLSVLLDGFVRRIAAPVHAGHAMDEEVRRYASAR